LWSGIIPPRILLHGGSLASSDYIDWDGIQEDEA
jgi:hypothetical protein